MNKYPFVSVIIPVLSNQQGLNRCLAALSEQTYPKDKYEVVVVDNSSEHPVEIYPLPSVEIKKVLCEKPGSYAARNEGIKNAKGEILAFTDSDCIAYPDWIEQAVSQLLKGVQRIGGRVELFYRSNRLTPSEMYEKAFAFDQMANVSEGWAVTANMVTWKNCFDRAGLFNEALMSGGDNEWGMRAKDFGIEVVYDPLVAVKHPARWNIRQLLSKRRRQTIGFMNKGFLSSGKGYLWIIHGTLPPLKRLISLYKRADLLLLEKLVATVLMFCLTLYSNLQKAKFMFSGKQYE